MTEPLGGRYALGERIASGGMGSVYAATDERLNRRVAVKILKEELAADASFVERFRREARAAAALSHPNVASVFDYGEDAGRHFIVMELVEGRDLARVLREEGPLPPERARSVASDIAAALAHAHAAGVVHRDIKPGNVMLSDTGRVKVTDFGIARAAGDSTLTAAGSLLGTASYISPEQAAGEPVGPASDIYSLGIVLYEMTTGSVPFTGESAVSVAMRHISGDVPRASALKPDIPPDLDEVIARATARSPDQRFPDAGAMHDALSESGDKTIPLATAAAAGTTERVHSVWPIPGNRWDPERVGRIAVIALVALGLLAAGIFIALAGPDEDAPTRRERAAARRERARANPSPLPSTLFLPNFYGVNAVELIEELEAAGFEVHPSYVEADEDAGIVVGSDPPAETEVTVEDPITLYISVGDEDDEDEDEEKDEEKDDDPNKGKSKGHGKGKEGHD